MSNTLWCFVHVLLLPLQKAPPPLPHKNRKKHTIYMDMSSHKSHNNCSNVGHVVEVKCFNLSMLPGSLSEIDWLSNISVYAETNVLQILSIWLCKSLRYPCQTAIKFSLRSTFTYTNLIVIFGADISSLVNKALHHFKTSTFSCHM